MKVNKPKKSSKKKTSVLPWKNIWLPKIKDNNKKKKTKSKEKKIWI